MVASLKKYFTNFSGLPGGQSGSCELGRELLQQKAIRQDDESSRREMSGEVSDRVRGVASTTDSARHGV